MSIGENIKKLREERGLTQRGLGALAGVSDKAVSSWECGTKEPRMGAIQRLADHFGLTISELIEGKPAPAPCLDIPSDFSMPKTRRVPLLRGFDDGPEGMVAQYADRSVFVPESIQADFALRWKDESLTAARVFPGDILFIRRQTRTESGALAALLVEGEVFVRRLYRYPSQLVLVAENPDFPPLVYAGKDQEKVQPLGAVVAFVSLIA